MVRSVRFRSSRVSELQRRVRDLVTVLLLLVILMLMLRMLLVMLLGQLLIMLGLLVIPLRKMSRLGLSILLKKGQQSVPFVGCRRRSRVWVHMCPTRGRLHLEKTLKLSRRPFNGFDALRGPSNRLCLGTEVILCERFFDRNMDRYMRSAGCVLLLLLLDPFLELDKKRSHHVELVRIRSRSGIILLIPLAVPKRGKLRELVPLNFTDLFPGLWMEVGVHGDIPENIESNLLIPHRHLDVLHFIIPRHQPSFPDVETCFLVDLSNGAVQVILVLVDFASGETPVGALLPALDQHSRVHGLIQQDSSSDGNSGLVLEKLLERSHVVFSREGGQQGTVLEDSKTETSERHRRECRVQRTYKIFVEPLCLFDLEANSGHG